MQKLTNEIMKRNEHKTIIQLLSEKIEYKTNSNTKPGKYRKEVIL